MHECFCISCAYFLTVNQVQFFLLTDIIQLIDFFFYSMRFNHYFIYFCQFTFQSKEYLTHIQRKDVMRACSKSEYQLRK